MRFLITNNDLATVGSQVYILTLTGKHLTPAPSLTYGVQLAKISRILQDGRLELQVPDGSPDIVYRSPEDLYLTTLQAWEAIAVLYRQLRDQYRYAADYFDGKVDEADSQALPF